LTVALRDKVARLCCMSDMSLSLAENVWTEQLDPANHMAVNSRLLVWQQKMIRYDTIQ